MRIEGGEISGRSLRGIALVLAIGAALALPATASAEPNAHAAADYCIPSPARDVVARIAQSCDSSTTQKQNAANQTKTANKIADFLDKYGDAAIGTGAAVMGYGLVTGPGEGIAAPVGLGIAIGGGIVKVSGAVIKLFWGDPFSDRNFKLIAKPLAVHIPALTGPASARAVDSAVSKLIVGELRLVELGDAYQASLNRAIGAHSAHNKRWTVRQLAAAARYAHKGIKLFLRMPALRAQLLKALEADGLPATYTLRSLAAAQRARNVRRAIAAFPKGLAALLTEPPLARLHLLRSFKHAVKAPRDGTFNLVSAFEPKALTAAEERIATDLKTFVLIVKSIKPGNLPAGI